MGWNLPKIVHDRLVSFITATNSSSKASTTPTRMKYSQRSSNPRWINQRPSGSVKARNKIYAANGAMRATAAMRVLLGLSASTSDMAPG